jgi:hypothetical protein
MNRPQGAAKQPESERRPDPGGCTSYDTRVFRWCLEQGVDVLLTVQSNHKTVYRQVGCQFQDSKRKIPFTAANHQKRHGGTLLWDLRTSEAPEYIKAN